MITPYYIYTRAGEEGKEEGRGAMESRRTGQKKRGRGDYGKRQALNEG